MSYLDAYRAHAEALRRNPNDVVAQIMLNKLEPATVVLFEAARNRAQQLAETHLNQWMFHNKKATYTKIASDLMDTKRWLTHGQMIGYQAARPWAWRFSICLQKMQNGANIGDCTVSSVLP